MYEKPKLTTNIRRAINSRTTPIMAGIAIANMNANAMPTADVTPLKDGMATPVAQVAEGINPPSLPNLPTKNGNETPPAPEFAHGKNPPTKELPS